MLGYGISCIVLILIVLAFIPAMIASQKNCSFVRWLIYGVLLFPIAVVHSILLKKPVRVINIYSTAEDKSRKKKTYKALPIKKNYREVSASYVIAVFVAKLVFGAFVGFIAFALIRTFSPDTLALRWTAVSFSVLLAFMLSITEICGFSRIPVIADEMTKRAITMMVFSLAVSIIMSVVKIIVTSNVSSHNEFYRFLCTAIAFIGFCVLLFNMQKKFYKIFYSFFDYCIVSIGSYTMYASVTLVLVTLLKKGRGIAHALSMPMQMFNFSYFSNVRYIDNLPLVYSAALVHLVVVVLLLLSGLQCLNYRKRELAFRVEYRSKAFRMTQRQPLRRHIPKLNSVKVNK